MTFFAPFMPLGMCCTTTLQNQLRQGVKPLGNAPREMREFFSSFTRNVSLTPFRQRQAVQQRLNHGLIL